MTDRIVITGTGVVSAAGTGKEVLWDTLEKGESRIGDVTLFDTGQLRSRLAGEAREFDHKTVLSMKGLRNLDRTTLLALTASQLALDDAGVDLPIDGEASDAFGVSLGSTMGSVWSISEFDKTALREGPRKVNPALFPNTVMNAPASQIAIKFNIKGFNSTISSGFCSSLDAVFYAVMMMRMYGYDIVLAGGVEELCEQTYKGFHKLGHLAGSREGKEEIGCPFDLRRNGILLGEGAAVFVLEKQEHAARRGAAPAAEILGYGTAFDRYSANMYDPRAEGATRAMKRALSDASLRPGDIDHVMGSANSTLDCDVMETRAVRNVFGEDPSGPAISSVKSAVGETFSAGGALNLAASLGSLERGFLPATLNYRVPDKRCILDCVPNVPRRSGVKRIMVDSFSPTGSNSVLVIGKV